MVPHLVAFISVVAEILPGMACYHARNIMLLEEVFHKPDGVIS